MVLPLNTTFGYEDPIAARQNQEVSLEQEQENRRVVEGYFNSFIDNTLFDYIDQNFTEDARYVVIQGEENNQYSKDSFSHERNSILPSTDSFIGRKNIKEFFTLLLRENNVVEFNVDKIIVEGNNAAVFGSFVYENKRTGNIAKNPPLAINIGLENGKINTYGFFENAYEFVTTSRVEATWTKLYDGTKHDIIFGGQIEDTLTGGKNKDLIYGYQSNDFLYGGDGGDRLWGGSGNDIVVGEAGDDILYGNMGNDQLIGGDGNDLFVLAAGEETDTIADFQVGEDLLGLSAELTFKDLTIKQDSNDVSISNIGTGEIIATLTDVRINIIDETKFFFLPIQLHFQKILFSILQCYKCLA